MQIKRRNALVRRFQYGLLFVLILLLASYSGGLSLAQAQGADTAGGRYIDTSTVVMEDGTSLTKAIINGPPTPPAGYELQRTPVDARGASNILTVPTFDWVFGCSSVSGSMIAGYYDRTGYPKMYTGPTKGGVMPLNNSYWPTWTDQEPWTYPNLPLAASHEGVDGRITKGSIDDYWLQYGSQDPDPYMAGGWTQHTWGDAIGDYMKTSQYAYGNSDGSTAFYNYTSYGGPLTCADMVTYGIDSVDGTYGRKLFYEARGYTVTDCYSQLTNNRAPGGFSYADYKAEIDAGRPVMINIFGHTIVGVGYAETGQTIYIHDTWDYNIHSMPWGGSYAGMQMYAVSIVNLASAPPIPRLPRLVTTDKTPTYKWSKVFGATDYRYQLMKGTTPVYIKAVTSSVCRDTNCTHTPGNVLGFGIYRWRVQAKVNGVWTAWSPFKTFTVAR